MFQEHVSGSSKKQVSAASYIVITVKNSTENNRNRVGSVEGEGPIASLSEFGFPF